MDETDQVPAAASAGTVTWKPQNGCWSLKLNDVPQVPPNWPGTNSKSPVSVPPPVPVMVAEPFHRPAWLSCTDTVYDSVNALPFASTNCGPCVLAVRLMLSKVGAVVSISWVLLTTLRWNLLSTALPLSLLWPRSSVIVRSVTTQVAGAVLEY